MARGFPGGELIIIRVAALGLTGLALWGNYRTIVSERDFQQLTQEKLYLVNQQIELKDCSKNRELLLTDIAVESYRKSLGKIINCLQENQSKMPSIDYFYSENFLEKLSNYQDSLNQINSNLLMMPELTEKIDSLLLEDEIVFSTVDGSFQDFRLYLFLSLLVSKYFYWLLVHGLLIVVTGVLFFGVEESLDKEESLFFDKS